ncbi:MAG TPA: hypothetical protein VK468_02975, partial [Pyrinomonadaceae bacterium]|nr:hypothetical protein [Pyrinomonadaceae bacterium]
MSQKVVYVGKDLEAMSFAVNYHKWIYEQMSGFLGKSVVEVGAGIGSFSEMLMQSRPDSLSLVEPSDLYGQLVEKFNAGSNGTKVKTYNAIFSAVADEISRRNVPDSI